MRNISAAFMKADSFVRQRDEYSCSAACLATAAALLGTPGDYDFFRNLLNPDPAIGVRCADLAATAKDHLPVTSTGEGCYDGGLAIACVFEKEGHYVVFLSKDNDNVIYYDPYSHKIREKNLTEIDWRSETEDYRKWCVNLQPPEGLGPDEWRKAAPLLEP